MCNEFYDMNVIIWCWKKTNPRNVNGGALPRESFQNCTGCPLLHLSSTAAWSKSPHFALTSLSQTSYNLTQRNFTHIHGHFFFRIALSGYNSAIGWPNDDHFRPFLIVVQKSYPKKKTFSKNVFFRFSYLTVMAVITFWINYFYPKKGPFFRMEIALPFFFFDFG